MLAASQIILIFSPIILTLLTLIIGDQKKRIQPFFENQIWNCYDVLVVLAFISLFQLCGFLLFFGKKAASHFYIFGSAILSVGIVASIYVILRLKYKKNISTLGFSSHNLLYRLIAGLKVSLLYESLFFAIPVLVGKEVIVFNRSQFFFHYSLAEGPWFTCGLFFFNFIILAPFVEEALRGFMYYPFMKKIGNNGSIVLTSLIWSAGHLNIKSLVSTFIIGVILCYLYKTNLSLIPSIVMHSMNSVISLGIYISLILIKNGLLPSPSKIFLLSVSGSFLFGSIILFLISRKLVVSPNRC